MAIAMWIAPFRTLTTLLKVTEGVDANVASRFHLAFDGEMALIAVLIIMQIITLVFMMQRSWRFVPMFIGMGVYAILLPLLDIAWSSTVLAALSGISIRILLDGMAPQTTATFIANTIVMSIWMLYVTRSRRVANTFVRDASLPYIPPML